MRWLVHISLLAAACAAVDATFPKHRQLPVQTALQQPLPSLGYPQQSYSYYLPPVQRYVYINGLPYAVLGEQLQYLPAESAGASTYTAVPVTQPGTLSPSVGVNAPPPVHEDIGQGAAPASAPSPSVHAADSVDTPVPQQAESVNDNVGQGVAAAANPTVHAVSTGSEDSSATQGAEVYTAPAPAPEPAPAPAPAPTPAPAPAPVSEPAAAPAPEPSAAPAPEPSAAPASEPSAAATPTRGFVPEPAAGPAVVSDTEPVQATPADEPSTDATRAQHPQQPAAAAALPTVTQSTSVYLSAAGQPDIPTAQRFLVLSVSNPKVTVRRKETVYSWHHPQQSIDAPISMVFYNDRNSPAAPAAPAAAPSADTKTIVLQPQGLTATFNSQPQPQPQPQPAVTQTAVDPLRLTPSPSYASPVSTSPSYASPAPYSPQPTTAAELIAYTLAQSPLLRVYVDPATRTSYYLDSEGHRVDLPATTQTAAPAPASPTYYPYSAPPAPLAAPSSPFPGYTLTASKYYGAASGMPAPAPTPSSASENYKVQGMTGLTPLERLYAPATYSDTAPQQNSYDKPLTLSISTGKEAEASAPGPQSPLSPGDFGPSRGDSVDNPARPKPLW